MHDPVKQNLERLLSDPAGAPPEASGHIAACPDCAAELRGMDGHARLLRALRAPEVSPAPGFHARVMARIEARPAPSFWTPLLDPHFGFRVAFTCAALFVAMATYLFTSENGYEPAAPASQAIVSAHSGPVYANMVSEQERPADRDSVLVTLASYRE